MQMKRLIRFRLATLLVLTAVVAVWTAAAVRPLRYLADAERIRELGGRVALDNVDLGINSIPYSLYCRLTNRSTQLPSVLALDERCPAASPVLEVAGKIPTLTSLDLTRSDVDDQSFAHLNQLRRVQHVRAQGRPITDTSMNIVGRWRDLRSASFHGTQITNVGVATLVRCTNLEELSLRSTQLSDCCVDDLIKLTHLRRLDVSRCGLSPNAIQRLRETLPGCDIDYRDPWEMDAEPSDAPQPRNEAL